MLEFALAYLRRGWPIFPLAVGTKDAPLVKWGQFRERLPTESEVREWWTRWPDANIALACGRLAGICTVDLEHEGLQTIEIAPNTMTITGKGRQGFFTYSEGLSNAAAIGKTKGYDIRGEGGYTILPPSIHPNGKQYIWAMGPLSQLVDFPAHVLADLEKHRKITDGAKPEGWIGEAISSLKDGNRNDTFARVVGAFHHKGLDKATIWTILLPHARACGFTDAELNSVIQSITRYATSPSRNEPSTNDSSIESFLMDAAPTDWLCEPIIAKESINFVAGLPETYKTWMLVDLAIECARGNGLWLGMFPAKEARVLYIEQERGGSETKKRFNELIKGKGIDPQTLKGKLYVKSGTSYRVNLDDSFHGLMSYLREIQPGVIIIDSFATFQTSDENDRMTMQTVVERLKEIKYELKCAIVFIDHEGKGAHQDQRDSVAPDPYRMVGSIGKIAAADSILTVRRYDPTTCAVYHTKNSLGRRVPGFVTHVVDVANGIQVYGEGGVKA